MKSNVSSHVLFCSYNLSNWIWSEMIVQINCWSFDALKLIRFYWVHSVCYHPNSSHIPGQFFTLWHSLFSSDFMRRPCTDVHLCVGVATFSARLWVDIFGRLGDLWPFVDMFVTETSGFEAIIDTGWSCVRACVRAHAHKRRKNQNLGFRHDAAFPRVTMLFLFPIGWCEICWIILVRR